MQKYHFYQEEAKGKYSTVFKARRKKKLQFVAIKRLQKNRKNKIMNEVQILTDMDHPNIIKFYEFLQTKNHIWEVTEYCPGGDLLKILEQDKTFPENIVRGFMVDILKGLQYCHAKGVVVCDLKLASILINQYGSCKIGDFGAAKDIREMIKGGSQIKKGTPSYMAPQLFIEGSVYSFQSDLWSAGCIMYELAQGNPPFISTSYQQIAKLSATAETPHVQQFSPDFNNLLDCLLSKDPEKRITWSAICKHPWLEGEIKNVQVPQQPHFREYLKKRQNNNDNDRTKLVRASQQFSKDSYGNIAPMNAKDKRQQFVFGNDDNQIQENMPTNQKSQQESHNYRGDKIQPEPQQSKLRKPSAFIKNKQKIDGRVQKVSALEDSTHVNLFLQQISRNQLIPIQQLINNSSDNTVKPIIGNKDIQAIQSYNFNKNKLGFEYIEPDTLAQGVVNGDMEMELQSIFKGMSGQHKEHVLGYFQSIIQNSEIANYLFKQQFIKFYLKLIRNYSKPTLKAKMYEILGFLVRHATVIQPGVLKEGIVPFLMEGATKQKSQIVRRKAMAAFGQLLFYGATQVDEGVTEWDTGLSTINGLQKILKNDGQDLIVKIYCCKTIQNITAQSKQIGTKFAQQDTVIVLLKNLVSTKNQGFRTSLCCCLHHILQLNGSLKEMTLQKLGIENLVQILKSEQISSKSLQLLLWVMINQFIKSKTSRVSRMLLQNEVLFRIILYKLDRTSSSIVRGRIYLYISYNLQNSPKKCLLLLENSNGAMTINHNKLFMILQKQLTSEQKHKYEWQCLQYVLVWLYQNFKLIIKFAQQQIKLLTQKIQAKQNTNCLPKRIGYSGILYHMINYKPFQQLFEQQQTIQQFFSIMFYFDSIPPQAYQDSEEQTTPAYLLEQIKNAYFQVAEKFIENQKFILKHQDFYSNKFLPWAVGRLLMSKHQDIKYNCIKYLIFLVPKYLNENSVYDSTVFSTTSNKVVSLISDHLIPSLNVVIDKKQSDFVLKTMFKLVDILLSISTQFVKKFVKLQKIDVLIDQGYFDAGINSSLVSIIRRCLSAQAASNKKSPPNWVSKVFVLVNKMLTNVMQTNQQRMLDEILDIYAELIRINGSEWAQQDLQKIWQKILPLQGCQDVVISQKAEKAISGMLKAGRFGSKGKWDVKTKPGITNYESYLKLSGKPQDPKVRENINQVMKNRYG